MLKIGDKLPAGKLQEFIEFESAGCSLGPNTFDVQKESSGKTIAVFALPGAFTPTCSAKHVPGYVENAAARRGLLDADLDDIADAGIAALGAAEHLDAHDGLRARVVRDVESRLHLDHVVVPNLTRGASAQRSVLGPWCGQIAVQPSPAELRKRC